VHDSSLGQEVLVMSVVLAFLADSPMHAEITSTPMPANSNNPCRVCHLSVDNRAGKQSISYVQEFFGNASGTNEVSLLNGMLSLTYLI